MKECKNCNHPIITTTYGLKNFCSTKCRNEYRKKYKRLKEKQRRLIKTPQNSVDNNGGYDSINSQLVDNTNQEISMFSEGQKLDFETEFGSKENYLSAKRCCNFSVKQREGYCITFYEPYFLFKTPCRDCGILKAIANRR